MEVKDIKSFVEEYKTILNTGVATELSYRSTFEALFKKGTGVIPVNDPKTVNHNKPDFTFLLETNTDFIVGYAEMKDVGVNLDDIERSNQWERYKALTNIFLTDGFEWRFYKNGIEYTRIRIVCFDSFTHSITPCPEYYEALANQLNYYFANSTESVTSGQKLAEIMGNRARLIRDKILCNVSDGHIINEDIDGMYNMFKNLLVEDLTIESFADMYSQTLIYGLFIARYNDSTPDSFSRSEARELIPKANHLLRDFFDHIAGATFDSNLQPIVDSLCQIFCVCDVKSVVSKHVNNDEIDYRDPIIHFYEDFLKSYDPILKKKMGAYYTPTPVVKFIIKAVDTSLKEDFGIVDGIASADTTTYTRHVDEGYKIGKSADAKTYYTEKVTIPKVQLLDPAVGTATFLNETIRYIFKQRFANQKGMWSDYVNNCLIKRLNGFEIMMTPYTIAHLKLGMTLQSLGATLPKERLRVFLTNTLTEGIKNDLPLLQLFGLTKAVTQESELAAEVKNEYPIMAIIGNPPYSGESSNKGEFAMKLVEKYKYEPGGTVKLQEKNPKWINDDYVKFIAFSEEMISRNEKGIMAMITNHGYLDNPTFRGMRWHLLSTFDKICIVDLHGNSKKKEVSPDGSKDENVFNIMQGVSIIIAIKKTNKKTLGTVYHADIYGTRQQKFAKLKESDIEFTKVQLDEKMYYFVPQNTEGKEEYEKGILLNELMPSNSVAVVTGNDNVLLDADPDKLLEKLQVHRITGQGKTAERLQKVNLDESKIVPIAYRLFDRRFIYFDSNVVERPRYEVMSNYISNNYGLDSLRNYSMIFKRGFSEKDVPPVHIADCISESRYWSRSGMQGIDYNAPLYVRITDSYMPNFNAELLSKLFSEAGPEEIDKTTPESTFFYIFAALHSRNYCKKYNEFIKADFPRVPRPHNWKEYWRLSDLGKKLADLYMMSVRLETEVAFPESGSNTIESVAFEDGKVYINETQFFENVPAQIWNTFVGGYQPAQKWLKDRKGKTLSFKDFEHYEQIISVLVEAERIMDEIDCSEDE